MWLTGRLAPDFKTIADFRRDNGKGIHNVCRRFVMLCRELKLFTNAAVAIDGSKFKAVNNRERNFTPGKIDRRERELEESIQRYLDALETADRTQPAEMQAKTERLHGKIQKMRQRLQGLQVIKAQLEAVPDRQISQTDPDARAMTTYSAKGTAMVGYNVQAAMDTKNHLIVAHEVTNNGSDRAQLSPMKAQCTTSNYRRIRRWEHEEVMDKVQQRLDRMPGVMTVRKSTVEHVFGTLKHWMGWTHFLTRGIQNVATEMSLSVWRTTSNASSASWASSRP